MKPILPLVMILLVTALSACTLYNSFNILEPYYPSPGVTVETFQPTFNWEQSSDSVSYDLIIWEGTEIRERAYYREGISDTKYTLEIPLKPNTEYSWAVRTRKGSDVSQWSSYNKVTFWGLGSTTYRNLPLRFKTPK